VAVRERFKALRAYEQDAVIEFLKRCKFSHPVRVRSSLTSSVDHGRGTSEMEVTKRVGEGHREI
jgi:hypothetical protein